MATTALTPAATAYRSSLYEWVTTTDHKKIGILYVINSFIFFFIGGLLALGVRSQLAVPDNKLISPENQYNQVFTMHASTMLFLFVIPVGAGFGNYLLPLMIGAKDMAYPRINALSLWLIPLAAIIMFSSFFVTGGSAQAGWTSYPPLTSKTFLPGHGTDLWILGVALIGTSSIRRRRDQLPGHDHDDARAGHDPGAHADLRLDDRRDVRARRLRDAGARGRADHAVHRPLHRHALLRPAPSAATRSSGSSCSGSTPTRPSTS